MGAIRDEFKLKVNTMRQRLGNILLVATVLMGTIAAITDAIVPSVALTRILAFMALMWIGAAVILLLTNHYLRSTNQHLRDENASLQEVIRLLEQRHEPGKVDDAA